MLKKKAFYLSLTKCIMRSSMTYETFEKRKKKRWHHHNYKKASKKQNIPQLFKSYNDFLLIDHSKSIETYDFFKEKKSKHVCYHSM